MEHICKNCEHCKHLGNTDETGQAVCSYPMSYFPININDKCHFLSKPYTCGDCDRYRECDNLCMTVEAEDSAYRDGQLCWGFVDKRMIDVYNAFADWCMRGYEIDDKMGEVRKMFDEEFEWPFVPREGEGNGREENK